MSEIQSPCVLICVIEQESNLCFGCGRTTQEITQWMDYSNLERSQIMSELDARLTTVKRKPRRETKRKKLARLMGSKND